MQAFTEVSEMSILDGAALARFTTEDWAGLFPRGDEFATARRALAVAVESKVDAETKGSSLTKLIFQTFSHLQFQFLFVYI